MKFFMKLFYQYMASSFIFPPTSSYFHPLQVENMRQQFAALVDDDDNRKFRLDRVFHLFPRYIR